MWGPVLAAALNVGAAYLGNRNANKNNAQPMNYLNQVGGVGKQYLQPFVDQGQQAQGLASGTYGQMAQNPTSFVDQILASYKPSQGYQFKQKNALNAARNSAAAGGFSGTGYDQMQQAELSNGLLGQDMQQYLQNILGVQGSGLQGQQHVADQGYGASNELASYLGNALGNQAGLSNFQNQQSQLNNSGLIDGLSQLFSGGIQGLGQLGGQRDAASMAKLKKNFNPQRDTSRLTTAFGGFK